MRSLAFIGVIVVSAAVVVLALVAGRGSSGGPLEDSVGTKVWSSDVQPGATTAFGIPLSLERGDEPVVLRSIRPADGGEGKGLRIRAGVQTVGGNVGSATGWQPREWGLRLVDGYTVEPGKDANILVGLAADKPGVHVVNEWKLEYMVGDETYNVRLGPATAVCVDVPCSEDSFPED